MIRTHRLSAAFAYFAVVAAWTAAGRAELLTSDASATSAEAAAQSPAEIRRLAREAYVWGWPLVYVQNCREAFSRVPSVGRSGGMPVAPLNELCMLTDYIAPTVTSVPCPNQDVVYGSGVFDLAAEPVVVQVPDFGDRFWVYQLGDARTDGFAELGKMYGTRPGAYLVVGPGWCGDVPPGIAGVFRCPTRIAYCVPRVFLDDTAEDRARVLPVVNQIMAYPLRRFCGELQTTDWSNVRWLPRAGSFARSRNKRVDPETFFDDLATVLADVAPLPGEESRYAAYRKLLDLAAADADVRRLLDEAAATAEAEEVAPLFEFRNVGTMLPHGWTTINNGAAFGTDYHTRLAVAKSNVFVNRNNETKYFYQDLDADGVRLDGKNGYRVTFAAGKLPPARGFWSLTLYDENHAFHANDLARFSLGTKSKGLRYNDDGSLTIFVGAAPPAAEWQSNWLPAPHGKFSLYLRAYWPEAEIVDGRWTPPPVAAEANAGMLASTGN